jgi:two-component system response regulator HydG
MAQPARLVFGTSASASAVLGVAERYARSRHPMLLLGERGTGKSSLARLLHSMSKRPGEFVKTSVTAIADNLELTQLTGHRRGAFTGATHDSVGLIESAQRGTFFLDELGLASARVQELLLHLLEERCIRRLGDVRDVPLDVRFIGATNADIRELADRGEFRSDLLDRFGYFILRLPPLRERADDILGLAKQFVAAEADVLDLTAAPELSEPVQVCFTAAPWPGNIRELQSVCHYAVLHAAPGPTIEMEHLPALSGVPHPAPPRACRPQSAKERVYEALHQARGNKSRAARLLGMSRMHLYRVLALEDV